MYRDRPLIETFTKTLKKIIDPKEANRERLKKQSHESLFRIAHGLQDIWESRHNSKLVEQESFGFTNRNYRHAYFDFTGNYPTDGTPVHGQFECYNRFDTERQEQVNSITGYVGTRSESFFHLQVDHIDLDQPDKTRRPIAEVEFHGPELIPPPYNQLGVGQIRVDRHRATADLNLFDPRQEFNKTRMDAYISWTQYTPNPEEPKDKSIRSYYGLDPNGDIQSISFSVNAPGQPCQNGYLGEGEHVEIHLNEQGEGQTEYQHENWRDKEDHRQGHFSARATRLDTGDVRVTYSDGVEDREITLPKISIPAVLEYAEQLTETLIESARHRS